MATASWSPGSSRCDPARPLPKSATVPPSRRSAAVRSQRVAGAVQCHADADSSRSYGSWGAYVSNGATTTSTGRPRVARVSTAAMAGSGSSAVTASPRPANSRVALPVPAPTSSAVTTGLCAYAMVRSATMAG